MKNSADIIKIEDPRIGELRELFAKYKTMYQIPGVPMEIIERNFEKYYLSSMRHFNGGEVIDFGIMGSNTIFQADIEDLKRASDMQSKNMFINALQNSSLDSVVFFVKNEIDPKTPEKVVEFVVKNVLKYLDEDLIIREAVRKISLLRDKNLRKRVLLDVTKSDNVIIKAGSLQKLYTIIFPDMVKQFTYEDALNIIRESLNDRSIYLRICAVKALTYFLDKDFDFEFYEYILQNQNEHPGVKLALLRLKLRYFDEYLLSSNDGNMKGRDKIVKQIIELSEVYNEELYSDHFNFEQLKMKKWKTGGKMETLGDKFLGKMITKYVPLDGFLAWRKLYESPKIWEEAGFDYVPMEPIISFKNDKRFLGLVKVQTGVLGMTVQSYENLGWGKFGRFIEDKMSLIRKVVESNEVIYDYTVGNHWREGNFCLRWERLNNSDEIDWTRHPRVYLIDFDHAKKIFND